MKNKNAKIKEFTSGFAFRMISGIVLWLLLFTVAISMIGYYQFTKSLTNEYNDSAFRTAESAAMLVNGDKIDHYLQEGFNDPEYKDRWERMDALCQKQNVTLIYVIKADTSDYGSFLSVFNTVNDSSGYTPWEVGYARDTTNDEYVQIYRDIYENGLTQGTVVRTDGLRGREAHITSLIPIKNSQGDVTAILCVERPMDELTSGLREYSDSIIIVTLILTIMAGFCLSWYLKRQFVKPVEKISIEADRFARENCAAQGEPLNSISEIRELRMLATSITKMEEDTLTYMDGLTRATAERERIAVELSLASTIQDNILPSTFPPYPNRKDFDIFASMNAAKEVGGDFYDFYLLDNDRLGFLVADVSGKGVPAALFMMRAKMTIKSLAESGNDVHKILYEANERLCEGNEAGMFVTTWLGIVDLRTGIMSYSNAGHNPPLIRHRNGEFSYLKSPANFVLAGMEGSPYRRNELQLLPGDELFLYTDGVTEATDKNEMLFGENRLLQALNRNPDEQVEVRCRSVKQAIDEFVGEAEQFDDITMLSISFRFFRNYESITTLANSESTEAVRDFINRRAKKAELSDKIICKVQSIVDEIYSDIHRYSGATKAQVFFSTDNEQVVLSFRDNGKPHNPPETAQKDTAVSAEELPSGESGIFTAKELASELSYKYEDGCNVLTVIIHLDA